jgi:hypothetical protein
VIMIAHPHTKRTHKAPNTAQTVKVFIPFGLTRKIVHERP